MTEDVAPLPVPALLRLLALTRRLAVPGESGEGLRLILDAARDLLGAERCTLFLYDADRDTLRAVAERGSVRRYLPSPPAPSLPSDRGLPGACARGRRVINVPNIEAGVGGNASLLVVPLIARDDELVGVLQLGRSHPGAFDANDENVARVLAEHAASAIQHERLRAEHLLRLKMERDLDAARSIQEGVLPRTLPAPVGYTLAAISRPAEQTGGDIYDAIWMGKAPDAPVALLLADASGHGIGPALSVVQVRAMLRVGLRLGAGLVEIIQQIDAQLVEDLRDAQFVTAFVGSLDPARNQLTYHSAGQGPLLHYHAAEQRAEWHGASAVPLGIGGGESAPSLRRMQLAEGDLIALLTDGFYERTSPRGRLFGRDRVADVIAKNAARGAQGALDALVLAVDDFAAGTPQDDDLTGLVVARNPEEVCS
ncbi:hypothetical protein LBMAG42_33950 [Deltaproteobacteria bacterium]|nr:hypothetical protein LBMAG42_33950 [Deltaproteobacteria bacterium]